LAVGRALKIVQGTYSRGLGLPRRLPRGFGPGGAGTGARAARGGPRSWAVREDALLVLAILEILCNLVVEANFYKF
jgi:hypothetical protein